MITLETINRLASSDVQRFIVENESVDEKAFVLKHNSVMGLASSLLASQIRGRRKAKQKLPTWYKITSILYPPAVNLEQSSSEETARYKTEIIRKALGDKSLHCADLTGGFGVDSYLFSTICSESISSNLTTIFC